MCSLMVKHQRFCLSRVRLPILQKTARYKQGTGPYGRPTEVMGSNPIASSPAAIWPSRCWKIYLRGLDFSALGRSSQEAEGGLRKQVAPPAVANHLTHLTRLDRESGFRTAITGFC